METLNQMIRSSLPTQGYEDVLEGSEPIELPSEPRKRTSVEGLDELERETERFGLAALEPVGRDEIAAYARAIEALRREEGYTPLPHVAQLQEAEALARLR